jgi:hypothetical protein
MFNIVKCIIYGLCSFTCVLWLPIGVLFFIAFIYVCNVPLCTCNQKERGRLKKQA